MDQISELIDKAIQLGLEGEEATEFVQAHLNTIQDIEAKKKLSGCALGYVG